MISDISYEEAQDAMSRASAPMSVAEGHGILAGLLCVDARALCDQWLALLFSDGAGKGPDDRGLALLSDLCEQTRTQLADADYSFELLLPDEESELSERAEALGDWCRGFLYGVGFSRGNAEWPADAGEVLRDLVEVTRLDFEVSGEADEQAYAEITEFVRMGVYLVRADLNQATSPILH
ncbi:UPF0149 family protein [Methylococcus sp. EFPC2]|uniref:UPF0149 family protein n=1 Tax=Methylococcus sp. EFPC2 TaxID=2812648 RepID=UPI001967EE4F|nr:UPF0149 family protein [Methylococcus sp. EFPC2]QSA96677.1 UPF0149 family protein [Methylococcus sp. EFPC2]